MCRFKSGIILKDRVFIPDYDSHTEMLEELKIADTKDNAKRLFVRAELVPPDDNVFAPLSEWEYRVDQDILPDWYVAEVDEKHMRNAVTEWAKEHIHIGEEIDTIDSGTHWIKDCKIGTICGSAKIEIICGFSEVGTIYGSAKIGTICSSAEVGTICGSAKIKTICGSAEVGTICGSAEVGGICGSANVDNICGSAKVTYIFDFANVKYICDSAEVGTICGSAEVGTICDSAKIGTICSSAKIGTICSSAEVGTICDSATATIPGLGNWEHTKSVCIKDEAVLIDRYGKKIYHAGAFEAVIVGGKANE